jgi:hypothetical protein
MMHVEDWDWDLGNRLVADLTGLESQFQGVHEFAASHDGERIAVPVVKDDPDTCGVWVNGDLWEGEFEKAWQLKFTPDGRLVALVRVDDEWTVSVDGTAWEETFDFVWDLTISQDGSAIVVKAKQEPRYTIVRNGEPWEQTFLALRDLALSDDGTKLAATVQVEQLPEADILKFMEGTWSVAVDGEAWDQKFINVYAPSISPDNARVGVEIRTDIAEYTICENGVSWNSVGSCIWEPCYRSDGRLIVPLKVEGGWTLAEDDGLLWKRRYIQLWHQRISPDGRSVAAVVAPDYGQWTIAVDDVPWRATFSDMVDAPVFSQEGGHVAAAVKSKGRWGIAVDGKSWSDTYDMVWDPVLSPDGGAVVAKVEEHGQYSVAANGKLWSQRFDLLWDPIFSSDGSRLLVRGVTDGEYRRQVIPVSELV